MFCIFCFYLNPMKNTHSKIILHRIISVVWLTNFLSEIRNLTNPRWWVEQQLLSVKRYQNSLRRSDTLMIAHLPFTGGWRELVLSEWFYKKELYVPLNIKNLTFIFCISTYMHRSCMWLQRTCAKQRASRLSTARNNSCAVQYNRHEELRTTVYNIVLQWA